MKISEAIGHSVDQLIYGESTHLIDSSTAIGVEVELESVNYYSLLRNGLKDFFWLESDEGSLRNGCEVVFSKPLKGINVDEALNSLQGSINKLKSTNFPPTVSKRTSIHVHMDVRDMDARQVNDVVELYLRFEGLFFNYVGLSRLKNNYCRPLLNSDFLINFKTLKMNEGITDYVYFVKDLCDKYSAVNVKSVNTHGSLEFRHHPGTINILSLFKWINLILSLKRYILSGKKINDILDMSMEEAVTEVFGELSELLISPMSKYIWNQDTPKIIGFVNQDELYKNTIELMSKKTRVSIKNRLITKYEEGDKQCVEM